MKIFKNIQLTSFVAFSQMKTRAKQSVIATAGVIFGVTVFIFLLAYVKGLNGYIQDITLEQTPHVRLYNEPEIAQYTILDKVSPHTQNYTYHVKPKAVLPNIKDGFQVIQEIRKDNRISAVSGSVKAQVFYEVGLSHFNGQITGIHYEDENILLNLTPKLTEGSFTDLNITPNSLVMASGLAKKINVRPGDKITVTTQKGEYLTMTVVGIFKTGIPEIDIEQCYASMPTVQKILSVPSSFLTDIKIKLHDKDEAFALSEEYRVKYGCSTSDWMKDNALAFENEAMQNMVVYCVAVCLLLVAGFGIYNILNMMIYEKMKEIAILKAMGFSDKDVQGIILIQSFVIGITGSLLGLLSGFLISYAISLIPYESELFSSINHLPISFNKMFYLLGLTFGILTAFFSGYIPARKAARIDPVYIIRV
ncbi:MAG: FtsX-like permease family protein [Tannerellaceae bacterium]|nr:FtsX-like permease family protein [Tannerellaceae bacterium]